MWRFTEEQLQSWYQHPKRKPLILRGARQVGKSTLVRQFAKSQNLSLIEINLERASRLNDIFKTNDVKKVFLELEGLSGQTIEGKNKLLFLDEIQATPHALPFLRYLFEDRPDIAVIAAGSLLEFVLAEHGFSMPVGRIEYLHLGPMSFGEFLLALKEDSLWRLVENFRVGDPFSTMAHERLLERQRQFLFVGGMPEAVLAYSETHSLIEAQKVHRSILQTYEDDFSKYSHPGHERQLLQKIIAVVPKIIGKKNKFSEISRDDRSHDVKQALDLLVKARLFTPAYHSDCSGVPLKAGQDDNIYKLYFLDVGLFNHLCGLDWSDLSSFTERELIHEGVLAEQFAAQHLAYLDRGLEPPHLNYWLRESRAQNAEVDFVTALGGKILPIEVKSGKSGGLKSLQQFVLGKKAKRAVRFDLNLPSLQQVSHKLTGPHHGGMAVNFELISLPLYMIEQIATCADHPHRSSPALSLSPGSG